MNLRPYQKEAIKAVSNAWKVFKKTLIVLPTGTGKTIIFSNIIKYILQQHTDKRILVLAHREELLQQAAEKIEGICEYSCGIEKAERTCLNSNHSVVVGSIQSLGRDNRLKKFTSDYFHYIIVDEAHHAVAATYQKVLTHFNKAKVLGVTATPDRADMQNLGTYFESVAYEYSLIDAIKDGFLVPIKAQTIPLDIDLRNVKITAGDFNSGDLEIALDPYLEQIADMMITYCKDRQTVVFLPVIKTSKTLCKLLNDRGFKAVEVNGQSENRQEALQDFEKGTYNVICNSMLLVEGWDCPPVDCVIVLRPTKSTALYSQCVGRGTRLYKGKKELLLLDFLWHTDNHELCRPANLVASGDIATKITTLLKEESLFLTKAINDIATREASLRRNLEANSNKDKKLIDPLVFEIDIEALDLMDYEPTFKWEKQKITKKQKAYLEIMGLCGDNLTKGKATQYIKHLLKRQKLGLATPKQMRVLSKHGFENISYWTSKEARKVIGLLSANGWQMPEYSVLEPYLPTICRKQERP